MTLNELVKLTTLWTTGPRLLTHLDLNAKFSFICVMAGDLNSFMKDRVGGWQTLYYYYMPPHDSSGVIWFHVGRPCVCPSVHPSVVRPSVGISFPDDNLSKHQWIFTKLGVCIYIVELCLGLLMGKFHQILTELPARDTHIFPFPDDNLSKCQGILTKLGTCIDMKEIWFGIAKGQISSMFDRVICPRNTIMAGYYSLTLLSLLLLLV